MKRLALVLVLFAAGCGGEDEEGRPLTIYTHCGVLSAYVDGQLWLADPPLRGGEPPRPWDENDTTGTWRETGDGRAVFTAPGLEAQFVRAKPGEADPARGCE